MAVRCGAEFSQFVLIVINVLVWIFSIILIGIGGYVLNNSSKYENLFGEDSNMLPAVCGIIIGVGCFIFLVGFLGCCGAKMENKIFLGMYFAILLILVIVELVGVILAFVYKSKIKDFIQENLKKQFVEMYGKDDQKAVTKAIDDLQMNEMCCGVNGYTDYMDINFERKQYRLVPSSCCKVFYRENPHRDCIVIVDEELFKINKNGCMKKLIDFVHDNLVRIGASALVLLFVQITAMIMSCCLIAGIGKQDYKAYA